MSISCMSPYIMSFVDGIMFACSWWYQSYMGRLVVNLYVLCQCVSNGNRSIALTIIMFLYQCVIWKLLCAEIYIEMISTYNVGKGSSSKMQWEWWSMFAIWIVEIVTNCLHCLKWIMMWSWYSLWVWCIYYEWCIHDDVFCEILVEYFSPWRSLVSFEDEFFSKLGRL